jgi:hypothetical protein
MNTNTELTIELLKACGAYADAQEFGVNIKMNEYGDAMVTVCNQELDFWAGEGWTVDLCKPAFKTLREAVESAQENGHLSPIQRLANAVLNAGR